MSGRTQEGPPSLKTRGDVMAETLKSIVFVVVTVMVALILQAHAGMLAPEQSHAEEDTTVEQIQIYN